MGCKSSLLWLELRWLGQMAAGGRDAVPHWRGLQLAGPQAAVSGLELEAKVIRRYAKILQSRRTPLPFASASQFHVYLPWVNACSACFNQEKALVEAFSVIVRSSHTFGKPSFQALVRDTSSPGPPHHSGSEGEPLLRGHASAGAPTAWTGARILNAK